MQEVVQPVVFFNDDGILQLTISLIIIAFRLKSLNLLRKILLLPLLNILEVGDLLKLLLNLRIRTLHLLLVLRFDLGEIGLKGCDLLLVRGPHCIQLRLQILNLMSRVANLLLEHDLVLPKITYLLQFVVFLVLLQFIQIVQLLVQSSNGFLRFPKLDLNGPFLVHQVGRPFLQLLFHIIEFSLLKINLLRILIH